MASAAVRIEEGTVIPGEEGGQVASGAQTPRDFDAEAREHGWVPKEEFKGDESRWVDAETFMKRADEMMPLLKAQNARMKRELEQAKKDFKRIATHMEGIEKRAYEKALSDIEERHKTAVEAGDLKAATDAAKELRDLEKPASTEAWRAGKSDAEVKTMATEALDTFRDENPWYDKANLTGASETEQLGRIYWDRMVDKHMPLTQTMPPSEFFAYVTDLTKDKYPALFSKAPREKPASAVEGGTGGRPRGSSKSWDNLPTEAKRQFEKFIGRGILGVKASGDKDKDLAASRAYYARTFDWEGYKE